MPDLHGLRALPARCLPPHRDVHLVLHHADLHLLWCGMSDKTGIEWTDATVVRFTEANGVQRARVYHRLRTDRPGTQERRRMRTLGLAWCSEWTEVLV